jgi:hypothetical protein
MLECQALPARTLKQTGCGAQMKEAGNGGGLGESDVRRSE